MRNLYFSCSFFLFLPYAFSSSLNNLESQTQSSSSMTRTRNLWISVQTPLPLEYLAVFCPIFPWSPHPTPTPYPHPCLLKDFKTTSQLTFSTSLSLFITRHRWGRDWNHCCGTPDCDNDWWWCGSVGFAITVMIMMLMVMMMIMTRMIQLMSLLLLVLVMQLTTTVAVRIIAHATYSNLSWDLISTFDHAVIMWRTFFKFFFFKA